MDGSQSTRPKPLHSNEAVIKSEQNRIANQLKKIESEVESIKRLKNVSRVEFELFSRSAELQPYLKQELQIQQPYQMFNSQIKSSVDTQLRIMDTKIRLDDIIDKELQFCDDLKKKQLAHLETHQRKTCEDLAGNIEKQQKLQQKQRQTLQSCELIQSKLMQQKKDDFVNKFGATLKNAAQQQQKIEQKAQDKYGQYKTKLDSCLAQKTTLIAAELSHKLEITRKPESPIRYVKQSDIDEKIQRAQAQQQAEFEKRYQRKVDDATRRQREVQAAEDEKKQATLQKRLDFAKKQQENQRLLEQSLLHRADSQAGECDVVVRRSQEEKMKRQQEIRTVNNYREQLAGQALERKRQLQSLDQQARDQVRLELLLRQQKTDEFLKFKQRRQFENQTAQIFLEAVGDKYARKNLAESIKNGAGVGKILKIE